jgi:hypothetical protein
MIINKKNVDCDSYVQYSSTLEKRTSRAEPPGSGNSKLFKHREGRIKLCMFVVKYPINYPLNLSEDGNTFPTEPHGYLMQKSSAWVVRKLQHFLSGGGGVL